MTDAVLFSNDRKEALSRAYVAAVAASVGYTISCPDFDRDGVDLQVRAGGRMRPSLDVQLKATTRLGSGDDKGFRFPLPRRNYDLLREPTLVPRVLVILDLPRDEHCWVRTYDDRLELRRSAYWVNLAGSPETTNADQVTVRVHKKNRFDAEGLKNLMQRARVGDLS